MLGYSDGTIHSLVERMGPNTYDLAKYASTFNQETLDVDVAFNRNQSEINMREMEQELELDDNSVGAKAHEIRNKASSQEWQLPGLLNLLRKEKVKAWLQVGVHRERLDLKDLVGFQQ